jgi:hypothetical protein
MATTQVQVLRSSVSGARPPAGSQPPGVLYVNFPDKQLGVMMPDGTPLDLIPTDTGSATASGDTPPANPAPDTLWYNTNDGFLYIYYDDGNSAQWVSIAAGGASADVPVTSVNAKIGDVVLTAADVGAADATHTHDFPVDSVNAKTGDVVLTAADVGAADAAHNHDGVYSPVGHNHDDRYPLLGHNHDGVYAPAVHEHDAAYVNVTGDSMSGDLEIVKASPSLTIHHPGIAWWKLYINGNDGGIQNHTGRWIWYSNNADFFVPGNLVSYWSDARLKEAVRDLDGYEERIMGLRPVSFAWNKKGRELTNRKYREREIGFIAQEAQSVSDQYVAENPVAKSDEGDAYLTVQKDEMIADLVAMVQQLNRRIAKLEGA